MKNSCKKGFLKLCSYVVMISLLLTSGLCSTWVLSAAKVNVSSIKVTNVKGKKLDLVVGARMKLNVTVNVKPRTATNKKVTFKSTNKKCVTVTSTGKVKGLKAGSAKVIITSKANPKKFIAINVKVTKKVLIKSIKLSETSLELFDDDEEDTKLEVSILPKNSSHKELIWSSSNEDVADVDEDGFVTPYSEGIAIIKVSTTDGSKKSTTCKVTVLTSDDDDDDDSDDDDDESSDDTSE